MDIHTEIAELESALAVSPDNSHLRRMIVKKMDPYPQYLERKESHLQFLLASDPDDSGSKNILLKTFFQLGKKSAAIIIGEELFGRMRLTTEGKLFLSKAYFQEGNRDKARELYIEAYSEDPSISDEELDRAFKQSAILTEDVPSALMVKPKIKFADVGGLEDVKREIELKIIKPLKFKDLYSSYGKKAGGGILLYGAPGCGKTYLAKATAGEIEAGFINVTLNDILDMWVGNSEKNLNTIFEEARDNAPCVLFFDEIDALGAKRSDLRQSAGRNVINQFLSELDGVESNNDGVLIIGATNVPWHLDPAFRRPGRFDRIIFVPPPDPEGREAIFKLKLADKPHENIDYKKLTKATKMYSGADINALIDIAIENILEKAMESGVPHPITTKGILVAIDKHKATTQDWFTTGKNYATFANQSGQYNDILSYIKKNNL